MAWPDSKVMNATGLMSGLIGILGFLTGIQSIPALVMHLTGTMPPPLARSPIPMAISYGILIISQATYFLSYFMIVRFLAARVLGTLVPKRKNVSVVFMEDPQHTFFMILLWAIGIGLSWLFAEAFWGPVQSIVVDVRAHPDVFHPFMVFALVAILGNLATVLVAYDPVPFPKRARKQGKGKVPPATATREVQFQADQG
jgi:hypothetical protein